MQIVDQASASGSRSNNRCRARDALGDNFPASGPRISACPGLRPSSSSASTSSESGVPSAFRRARIEPTLAATRKLPGIAPGRVRTSAGETTLNRYTDSPRSPRRRSSLKFALLTRSGGSNQGAPEGMRRTTISSSTIVGSDPLTKAPRRVRSAPYGAAVRSMYARSSAGLSSLE